MTTTKYDYLIVGSGLFGSTFAYRAKKAGKKCLVIDKRSHLGGNVYCENIEGINVHKYGAHIFHTSNKKVWDFVNSIVEFNRYTNSPVANYKGKLYNLPFNMNTFYQMWGVTTPEQAMAIIEEQKAEAVVKMKADGVMEPRNLEEQAKVLIGKDIYEKLIKEYTEKQWGRKCTELPAFIIKRLPVRFVFDNNYFNDKYQGIPIGGYNQLIDGLLAGIETVTSIDFFTQDLEYVNNSWVIRDDSCMKNHWRELADRLVFTGQLDQYFDYQYGKLDWRTVSFKTRVEDTPNYQGNAVVNYTSHDEPYTRVIEHKHFELFGLDVYSYPKTVVSEEYSTEYTEGMEPYYPVNDNRNNTIADAYRKLAHQEGVVFPEDLNSHSMGERKRLGEPRSGMGKGEVVIFGGRLAEYKYYDMAPIIEIVLGIDS